MLIQIPASTPYGLVGVMGIKCNFSIPFSCLPKFSKHSSEFIDFTIWVESNRPKFTPEDLDYKGLIITKQTIKHFLNRHDERESKFTILINIEKDIKEILNVYSSPEDMREHLVTSLIEYAYALFSVSGPVRLCPVFVDDGRIDFCGEIAYLLNPSQDWFRSRFTLDIIFDRSIFKKINSQNKQYETILNYLESTNKTLELNILHKLSASDEVIHKDLFKFGKVISSLVRQNPSFDFDAIIGTLTAYVEGLLLIDSEHTYKFKIKVSNLLKEKQLGPALKAIYGRRSNYYHSAVGKEVDDIFDFINIEMLLVIIQKIFISALDEKITKESFDFVTV